jgi:hypothetical protein
MKYFGIVLSLFLFTSANSQENQIVTENIGNVEITKDCRFDTLTNRILESNDKEQKLDGYRIQLYSGSNSRKANEIRTKFIKKYPEMDAYLDYKQPYFKVRIGNYRNVIEAQKMFYTLKEDEEFSRVMIVPETIDLPELK